MRASDLRNAFATLPELRGSGLDLEHHKLLFDLCEQMDGLPRQLSVHVGGVIVGDGSLAERMPLQWSAKGVIICPARQGRCRGDRQHQARCAQHPHALGHPVRR